MMKDAGSRRISRKRRGCRRDLLCRGRTGASAEETGSPGVLITPPGSSCTAGPQLGFHSAPDARAFIKIDVYLLDQVTVANVNLPHLVKKKQRTFFPLSNQVAPCKIPALVQVVVPPAEAHLGLFLFACYSAPKPQFHGINLQKRMQPSHYRFSYRK